VVDDGFDPQSGKIKNYKIGIVSDCCLMPNEHFFLLYHGKNKLDPMKL
jgi:hypothetical protein